MYQLPKLPYLYQDLEPYIDTHTMGLHYNKHEKNYLKQLNVVLIKNNYDFKYTLSELVYHIDEFMVEDRGVILYNLGGVLNHNLYWNSMNPFSKQKPNGNLEMYINKKYGSYEKFWDALKDKALKLTGSGYVFLVLKDNNELDIINMPNQDTPLSLGFIPLFTIDLWEHAYYLNYENNKSEYLDNFKEVADFTTANRIFNNIVK